MLNTFLTNFAAFWETYGAYIGAALIPTIITGLSLSPKTEKAGPLVQKIWDGIKMAMNFLSVLTHKDKPGTFQLPMKAGALLPKKPGDGGGAVALALVLLVSSQASCSWWQKNGGDVKKAAISCAKESVQSSAGGLMNTMVGILTGASEDSWRKQTASLAKSFGQDAVACATRLAMEKITNPVQSEPDPEVLKATATARARALEVENGWAFTE